MNNFEDIILAIKDLKARIADVLPFIQQDIDNIISARITDEQIIEKTLDVLLDYTQLGLGERQFQQLVRYYTTINEEHAGWYEQYYQKDK